MSICRVRQQCLCVSGAQDDTGKLCFRNTKHTFITGAVGTKAENMNRTTELHDLQAADTVAFELQTCSMELLPMLSHSADSVLPATLAMIRKSDHYTMAVQYITQQVPPELSKVASKTMPGVTMLRPCSRAVVLVLSSKRSKVSSAGAGGHKLVTDNVVDFLRTDGAVAQEKYKSPRFVRSTMSQTSNWIHRRTLKSRPH